MLGPMSGFTCFFRHWKMFFKVNDNAVSYAATTVAATLMHSVFQFYYVKLFLDHYRYVISTFMLILILLKMIMVLWFLSVFCTKPRLSLGFYFRITTYWFNIAQVFYMLWNAVNDPLFGYFQVIFLSNHWKYCWQNIDSVAL